MLITSINDDIYVELSASWHQFCAISDNSVTLKALTACLMAVGMDVIERTYPENPDSRHPYPLAVPVGAGNTVAITLTNLSRAEEIAKRFRPGLSRRGRLSRVSKHTVLKWALSLGLKTFRDSLAKKD